jgi:hypothetical protein
MSEFPVYFAPQWRGKMIEKYVDAVLREVAGLPVERLLPHHGDN